MKQETILKVWKSIVAMAFIGTIAMSTVTATVDISNTYEVTGNGIIDRSVEINTQPDYTGLKFTGTTSTPCLGLYGMSNLTYKEEIYTIVGNSSDISVNGAIEGETLSQKYCQRNYDLGVRQSHGWKGDSSLCYDWMIDNRTSIMMVEGKTIGKVDYTILVKDLLDSHKKIYDEDFEFKGILDYTIESVIENTTYPGAGLGDWLGCP